MNSLWFAGREICSARISDKERKEKSVSQNRSLIFSIPRNAFLWLQRGSICSLTARFAFQNHIVWTCFFFMVNPPNCVSLPFIRNHAFAPNSTKCLFFKAFRWFSSRLQGRLKKENVNLSLKNAILCLSIDWVHFIHMSHPLVKCLFFDYRDALFDGLIAFIRTSAHRKGGCISEFSLGNTVTVFLHFSTAIKVWRTISSSRNVCGAAMNSFCLANTCLTTSPIMPYLSP